MGVVAHRQICTDSDLNQQVDAVSYFLINFGHLPFARAGQVDRWSQHTAGAVREK